MPHPSAYSAAQLAQYFSYIDLPERFRSIPFSTSPSTSAPAPLSTHSTSSASPPPPCPPSTTTTTTTSSLSPTPTPPPPPSAISVSGPSPSPGLNNDNDNDSYSFLHALHALHTHQLATIPYENLLLHYRAPAPARKRGHHHDVPHALVSLDPAALWEKIMGSADVDVDADADADAVNPTSTSHLEPEPGNPKPKKPDPDLDLDLDPKGSRSRGRGRGRGGYCMELSVFFNHILRACGFEAYLTGARIRLRSAEEGVPVPRGEFVGWMHVVNIVTLPSSSSSSSSSSPPSRYMVDVSFGGDGATRPLPLPSPSQDPPSFPNLGTQEIRLIWGHLPGQLSTTTTASSISTSPQSCIYQYRNATTHPWNSFYAFSPDTEWLPTDLEAPNYFVSQHPDSFQRHQVLVVKFRRDDDGGGGGGGGETKIVGKRMLVDGVVKENSGGKTMVVKVCEREEERVEALRELFGIGLTGEEREGIWGTGTELGGRREEGC